MAGSEPGEYRLTIKEMPETLRPRERLAYVGPNALSTAELLAIILRTGGKGENVVRMAERLLAEFQGLAARPDTAPSRFLGRTASQVAAFGDLVYEAVVEAVQMRL